MMRFRVRLWRDGGFWTRTFYTTGMNAEEVRRRLEREQGREVARNSAVTAYADVVPGLNPDPRQVP